MNLKEYISARQSEPALCESSLDRILRIVSRDSLAVEGYPFRNHPSFRSGERRIYGLVEVLDAFVEGVRTATFSYKKGQTPLFVITGPPGCGKTELGLKLEDMLIDELSNAPRYTFSFKEEGVTCLYNEEPYNLLTSRLSLVPSNIRETFYEKGRAVLCPNCTRTYNKILRSKDIHETKFDNPEVYLDFLSEFIELQMLAPPIATADLTKENLSESINSILQTCNRGILHIEVNDCKFDDVPVANYQTLLKLADGRYVLDDGTSVTPDVTILLYTNWEKSDIDKKKPFADRTIHINMRWNLSWDEEVELYKDSVVPFKHISNPGIEGFAIATVGSRIDLGSYSSSQADNFIRTMEAYVMFEEMNPAMSETNKADIFKRIQEGRDGRSSGYSIRVSLRELNSMKAKSKDCLTPSDAIEWIRAHKSQTTSYYSAPPQSTSLGESVVNKAVEHINLKCISDVVMAYLYEKNKGGRDRVEEIFMEYYGMFTGTFLRNVEHVSYMGKMMAPADVLVNIEERLGISHSKSSEFRQAIQHFMDQTLPKRIPTFMDIYGLNPSIVVSTFSDIDYLPWEKIARNESMTGLEETRISTFITNLVSNLGYCNHCAHDAIYIAASQHKK